MYNSESNIDFIIFSIITLSNANENGCGSIFIDSIYKLLDKSFECNFKLNDKNGKLRIQKTQ